MSKCLYNGHLLPALPEWDKEKYPYAVMVIPGPNTPYIHSDTVQLYCGEYPWNYNPTERIFYSEPNSNYCAFRMFDWGANAYQWQVFGEDGTLGETGGYGTMAEDKHPRWANYDVMNTTDGSLYLASSDPVPVPQLNPAALMHGFATMLSLRRNRT